MRCTSMVLHYKAAKQYATKESYKEVICITMQLFLRNHACVIRSVFFISQRSLNTCNVDDVQFVHRNDHDQVSNVAC